MSRDCKHRLLTHGGRLSRGWREVSSRCPCYLCSQFLINSLLSEILWVWRFSSNPHPDQDRCDLGSGSRLVSGAEPCVPGHGGAGLWVPRGLPESWRWAGRSQLGVYSFTRLPVSPRRSGSSNRIPQAGRLKLQRFISAVLEAEGQGQHAGGFCPGSAPGS